MTPRDRVPILRCRTHRLAPCRGGAEDPIYRVPRVHVCLPVASKSYFRESLSFSLLSFLLSSFLFSFLFLLTALARCWAAAPPNFISFHQYRLLAPGRTRTTRLIYTRYSEYSSKKKATTILRQLGTTYRISYVCV